MKKMRRMLSAALALFAGLQLPVIVHAESMGETLQTAGFNTVLGVGTVFIMLIVMSLIIYCFRIIPVIQDKLSGKGKKEEPAPVAAAAVAPVVEDLTDDLELVAVIAAAIAASEQVPIDSFRVRTIKRRA